MWTTHLYALVHHLWMDVQFQTIFTDHLRNALAFYNLDLQRYQSHSFRIGEATMDAFLCHSELQIQNIGRWHSSAFKKYIQVPTLSV